MECGLRPIVCEGGCGAALCAQQMPSHRCVTHLLALLHAGQEQQVKQQRLADEDMLRSNDLLRLAQMEVESFRTDLAASQTKLAAARTEASALQTKLGTTRTELFLTQEKLGATRTELSAARAESAAEISAIRTSLGKTRAEVLRLDGLLRDAGVELESTRRFLESSLEEQSHLGDELQRAETELSKTQAELGKAHAELGNIKARRSRFDASVDQRDSKLVCSIRFNINHMQRYRDVLTLISFTH